MVGRRGQAASAVSSKAGPAVGTGDRQASQAATIALLEAGATHGVERVERIDTHASIVFLAGSRAIKLKRAVRYPYLDYGTPERRREMCAAEVRINRRTAPDLYLGIAPIVAGPTGVLALGELDPLDEPAASSTLRGAVRGLTTEDRGETEIVDWVVIMRRVPDEDLMVSRAEAGAFDGALADAIADEIARFHRVAEAVGNGSGGEAGGYAARMASVARRSLRDLESQPDRFSSERVSALAEATEARLAALTPDLDERATRGAVRRCHGDLHLGNLVMWAGRPTLFDSVEFDPALVEIDVLYDLAFLLMDLVHRGLQDRANRILSRYLAVADDHSGLRLLPLYLSMRAAIRAKVTGRLAAIGAAERPATPDAPDAGHDAIAYLETALRVFVPEAPRCLAIGGLSGTGKSTLAAGLAPEIGAPPGAIVLRSDVTRKVMLGVAPEHPLPESAYRPQVSERVYDLLVARADEVLRAGRSVVVDAVFADRKRAEALKRVASAAGADFVGLWLSAPRAVQILRVTRRRHDASDARADVVRRQLERLPEAVVAQGPDAQVWHVLDAAGAPSDVLEAARAIVARPGAP